MPTKNLEFLKSTLFILLYAVLFSPLLLSSNFFFPYISSKVFYFRLLIEILVGVYMLVAAADPRFRPRLTPLVKTVLIFGAASFLTSLAGLNFYRSFWGNIERGEGLLTILHILAFFLIAVSCFSELRHWEKFFSFSVVVSLASAGYALLQKFGAKFVVAGDVSRVSATIGNASFYAGYLLLHIYLAAWLATRTSRKALKWFYWLVILFELYILNETGTRGAVLGLFAGLLFALVFLALTAKNRKFRLLPLGIFSVVLLAAGCVWAIKDTTLISPSSGLYRVTHLSAGDITTQSRLLTWQAGFEGWKDRWLTGYGYENFNLAFNRYFPAAIFRDNGSQIWFDRAHNIVFDTMAQSGIIGLLLYLSLYVLSFWHLWKYYRQAPEANRLTSALFSALLVSYFIQNLFVFDTLGTYILFYSILGFVSFLSAYQPQIRLSRAPLVRGVNYYLASALVVGFALVSFFAVWQPAYANTLVLKALYRAATGQFGQAVDTYQKIFELRTYVTEEARQKFAEMLLNFNSNAQISPETKLRAYHSAIEELQQQIHSAPYDARNYLYLMTLYNAVPSSESGPKEEVIRLGKEALELSPTRPQLYFEMGQAAYALGRADEGLSYFQKALKLNDFPAESHWNLALAYALKGRFEETSHELDYALDPERAGMMTESSLKMMAQILEQKQQFGLMVRIYKELLRRAPNSPTAVLNLAGAYARACDVEQANVTLNKLATKTDEQAKAMADFRKELSSRCGK